MINPHSIEWYRHVSTVQSGYFYPWKCEYQGNSPDEEYDKIVNENLMIDMVALDAGCGHGLDCFKFGPKVKKMIGYDVTFGFLIIAVDAEKENRLSNTSFIQANSSSKTINHFRIPLKDNSVDMFLSRRGPRGWIEDVPRVGKSEALMIQLNPIETEAPEWNTFLPESIRVDQPNPQEQIPGTATSLRKRLSKVGAKLLFEKEVKVTGFLKTPLDTYLYLKWKKPIGKAPRFEDVQRNIENIHQKFGNAHGVEIEHGGYIWMAQK